MATGTVGTGASDLIAAAFSSTIGSTVVTFDQYKKNKDKKNYEPLELHQLFDASHQYGPIGDGEISARENVHVAGPLDSKESVPQTESQIREKKDCTYDRNAVENDKKVFTLRIGGLGEKFFIVSNVAKSDRVSDVKVKVYEQTGIAPNIQRFLFQGKLLIDDHHISDYPAMGNNSTLMMVFRIRGGGGAPHPLAYYVDDSLLDPHFDYDFTRKVNDGTKYFRGGYEYQRPYGWKRYALKVVGKYENDKWLGDPGQRLLSSDGEWPVSYHGTGEHAGRNIAQEGYRLSKGKRFKFGYGIYSTPSIEVAEMYAKSFTLKGKLCKMVLQNRVCPTNLQIVNAETTGVGAEYWVHPKKDFIRPYGFCVKMLNDNCTII